MKAKKPKLQLDHTPDLIRYLVGRWQYHPLPKNISMYAKMQYKRDIPEWLTPDKYLATTKGTLICAGFTRIVIGDYGAYIEFTPEQAARSFPCAKGQEWRGEEKYKHCKYYWLNASKKDDTKIYLQRNTVKYADYKVGMYYVSIYDIKEYKLL